MRSTEKTFQKSFNTPSHISRTESIKKHLHKKNNHYNIKTIFPSKATFYSIKKSYKSHQRQTIIHKRETSTNWGRSETKNGGREKRRAIGFKRQRKGASTVITRNATRPCPVGIRSGIWAEKNGRLIYGGRELSGLFSCCPYPV